jgi:hypothetical protein
MNRMQPEAHTDSYYAATANDVTNFAPLQGEQRADVCVIGAGFTGISTALHLAERGYNVHVVEANKVGWGASGRNGGQMIGGISGEIWRVTLGRARNYSRACTKVRYPV